MIISIRVRLQMDGRMGVCNLMKYQIFLVQTAESILIQKTNRSYFVYNYFSFVFSQFSLSTVFMKLLLQTDYLMVTLNRARLGCYLHKSAAPQQNSHIFRFSAIFSWWLSSNQCAYARLGRLPKAIQRLPCFYHILY